MTLIEQVRHLQEMYSAQYLGTVGDFQHPMTFCGGKDKLIVAEFDGKHGLISVFDAEQDTLQQKVSTDKWIVAMAYWPQQNAVLFSEYVAREQNLYWFDLKTQATRLFIPAGENMKKIAAISVWNNRAYVLDSYAHALFEYSVDGTCVARHEFKGVFEFPLAFGWIAAPDQILLQGMNAAYYQRSAILEQWKPHASGELTFDRDLAVYHLETQELNQLPQPGFKSSLDTLRSVERAGEFLFLNTDRMLFKLRLDLSMVFRTRLDRLVPDAPGLLEFHTSYAKDGVLYILERQGIKKILKLRIG